MTAPLPGIRPGQIWQSRQLVRGGRRERIEIIGCGPDAVSAVVLRHDDKPPWHRSIAREDFEQRYTLVSEPGVVAEDG